MSGDGGELVLSAPEPAIRSGRPGYKHAADAYEHLGISRRTVFRWLEYGDSCRDWPPLDAPEQIAEWWERMRRAEMVTNRLPAKVTEAIALHLSGSPPPSVEASPREKTAPAATTAAVLPVAGGGFDPESEIRAAEDRLVALREARDAAYAANDRIEGDKLDRQYWDKFGEFTVISKRVNEYRLKRGELVSRAAVEADLSARVVGIAVGGMFFFAQIQTQLDAAPDTASKNAIWRACWREKVGALLQSRYVPEFLREVPEQLWADVLAFIEARRPPALALSAD